MIVNGRGVLVGHRKDQVEAFIKRYRSRRLRPRHHRR
jgi:hypothetical protein